MSFPISPFSDTSVPAAPAGQSLSILTCSMAAYRDVFALLSASVDRHVDPRIRHDVVVPGAYLEIFRSFETPQRRIIAQEDVLPVRLFRLPRALKLLAPIRPLFRRPFYVTPKAQIVRGWMVPKCLKIGMSCACPETGIMHVDSDVCFFRHLTTEDAFAEGRTRFFRAVGETKNPMDGPRLKTRRRPSSACQCPPITRRITSRIAWSGTRVLPAP